MSKLQDLIGKALKEWFPGEEILENYRPEWLGGLEFDFYLPNHKVAIEVQGQQHRRWCPTLQKTPEDHKAQRRRDSLKRKIAGKMGVMLFAAHVNHLVMGGLQDKLSRYFHRYLRTPQALRYEWDQHRRFLNSNHFISMKMTKRGPVPVNKKSAQYFRSMRLAPAAS